MGFKGLSIGKKNKENAILAPDTAQNEAACAEGAMTEDELGLFDDLDGEKTTVEEWWLQKGVEDPIEEDLEDEDAEEGEEEQVTDAEKVQDGSEYDLIYGLKAGAEDEDDDEDLVLKKVREEMGTIVACELLELGQTALSEMQGETNGMDGEVSEGDADQS